MRALVTGITGFVGGHLAEHLVARGDTVTGLSRSGAWPPELEHLRGQVTLWPCELAEGPVRTLLDRSPIDTVFHLAGLANPRSCRDDPAMAHRANVVATANLYHAICLSGQRPAILFVSTGFVYGDPACDNLPIRSTAPLRGRDPYATTKWKAEDLSVRFATEYGLAIVRVRPFNHVGPRQPTGYIVADWARQIAAIEAGQLEPLLRVGNVYTRRDYSDVRDIVRAYRTLACDSRAFSKICDVYNLGSGISRSGSEILDRLRAQSPAEWRCEVDEQLIRPGEPAEIVADATPLRELTGWQPEIDFDTTLRDTLDYWRLRLR